SDTAVVLADENLLLPFLLSYKPEKVLVNATMGIPFATTPVYALIQQLLAVYESAVSLSSDIAAESLFSGEMVEQLWEHELLRLAKPQAAYFPTVLKYSQLPHSELFASDSKTIQSRLFPTVLLRFCQFAESVTVETLYKSLWKEVNRILSEMQTEFNNFFAENELVDFAFLKFAVTKETSMVTISMEGDSSKGLQVMGLLETRLMDFKNVIMLSVNEGVLPKGITYDSLLPFDFKFKLDGKDALPNYLYQDQVYAYHFFRLLQRAENVSLIYNRASDVSIAERSRFIAQLEYEAQVQNLSNIKINHYKLDFNLDLPACEPLKIEKSEDIMKRLHAFEFSASSLQAYIACPLKFCFRFLMRIRETQVLGDRMESYELGTVVHALFKKALDEVAAEPNPDNFGEIINRHIARTDEDVCAEIRKLKGRKDLSDSDLLQGQWLINRRVIGETVNRYLEVAKRELRDPSWKITDNELQINQLRYPVVSEDGNRRIEVVLTGSLDRVQKCGNNAMILDYKTGKVEASKLQVKVPKTNKKKAEAENQEMAEPDPLAPIFDNPDYEKLFQLVFYAIMYDFCCLQKPKTVQAGIISTHEINKNNPNYIFHASILGDGDLLKHKTDLSKHLDKLFLKIFDDKTPFLQTEDTKRCKNCEFLHLCGRQTVTGRY
ncbi:MAG: PD-(D/E)XK nuclease family protein, partial [Bacteroidales bacterium]|nr:PD-(D/E)XK nuclease family protein [Bacteroidales bacterium]